MVGEIHATDANELGLPCVYSDPRRRICCDSLDIGAIPAAQDRKIHRHSEDFHHTDTEATKAIQTCAGGDAHTTIVNLFSRRIGNVHRKQKFAKIEKLSKNCFTW